MPAQAQYQAFARDLTREAMELLRERMPGAPPGGAGTFRVVTMGDCFQMGLAACLADEGTVAAILAKVAEVLERHDMALDVSRQGEAPGAGFVIEGRLAPAPAAGPPGP